MSSFSGLLNNAVLLLALGVIYDTLGLYKLRNKPLRGLLSGLLIGLVGIAVMLTPWELKPGVFFDTRWVLLSLCGLFFGTIPTLIAVIMTVSLRLFQGGGGMYVGSIVIITTAGVGLLWRYFHKIRNWHLSWWNLYLFGVLVQLDFLACMFLMPANVRYKILATVGPPVLLIFPVGTALLGLILRRQRDRRTAEFALEEHRQLLNRERGLLNDLIDSIPDVIYYKDKDDRYLGCNKAFEQVSGIPKQAVPGKTDDQIFSAEMARQFQQQDQKVLTDEIPIDIEEQVRMPDGETRIFNTVKVPFRGLEGTVYGLAGISRDITDSWREAKERKLLQEQLAQSQKMETVGQLAGGIAHDFNNMLAVILGQTELAKLRLDDKPRLSTAIDEIQKAARRSSDLTQQLLAFARKQAITPKVMDLNSGVSGMATMLHRLIGENVELSLQLKIHLWKVKIDPNQLDQILTNICINARDAIEGHGKLVIETNNIVLDEAWTQPHYNLLPGKYVVISISDNGKGIPPEVRKQIFDPFFTTKKVGEGTGLGLATVYGIVKQNNGIIDVYSELDLGTTFKIYLPASETDQVNDIAVGQDLLLEGSETILVVEDEEAVLDLTTDMLKNLGYTVLSANTPKDGLKITATYPEPIDLLLTDVVMPEGNGLDFSTQLTAKRPGLKTLFMSGYTAEIIAKHGILEEGLFFIEKPFSLTKLSQKIRETLDAPQGSATAAPKGSSN